jgi:hypothetical protein
MGSDFRRLHPLLRPMTKKIERTTLDLGVSLAGEYCNKQKTSISNKYI